MRYVRSYLFVVLCMFSALVSAAPKDEPLRGVVVDAVSGAPIEGAEVRLLAREEPVVKTSADGSFAFERPAGAKAPFAVSVAAEGFRPREANVAAGKPGSIALSAADAYRYFPPVQLDDGLKTGDLSKAKLARANIDELMNKALAKGYQELHSVLVYRNGVLALEEYFHGNDDFIRFEDNVSRDSSRPPVQWSRTRKHYVASINKAMTGAIAGIALNRHKVSVDEKISKFLPTRAEYFKDENKAKLTFRHFLNMQTGFYWDEWVRTDLQLMWQSKDFTEFLLSRDNHGPKSEWRYISAAPNVVLEALDNMVDGSIRDFGDANFYRKLGITDYDWQSQPTGLPEGGARLHLRPRDMLKIGVTYLDGGKWGGKQVVPAAWVKETFKIQASSDAGDYSLGFWHRKVKDIPYLAAEGDGGQVIAIFPQYRMVVVITQGNYLEWPLYVKQAEDIMGTYILAAMEAQSSGKKAVSK